MPFNANNPYSIVAQVMRDPMPARQPARTDGLRGPITEDESLRILRLHQTGISQTEIGHDLGRSYHVIGTHLRSKGISTGPRKRRGLDDDSTTVV